MNLAHTLAIEDEARRANAWIAGFTKPRHEGRALESAQHSGFECLVPIIRTQRRVQRELGWGREAMFPRNAFDS